MRVFRPVEKPCLVESPLLVEGGAPTAAGQARLYVAFDAEMREALRERGRKAVADRGEAAAVLWAWSVLA